jgi:hypothetical protein
MLRNPARDCRSLPGIAFACLLLSAGAHAEKTPELEPVEARVTRIEDAPAPVSDEAAKLFDEARKLSAEGNVKAACKKFEESATLSGGIGTKFNLADCWERLGKTHSAHALFLEVAGATRALGQVKREQAALSRANALESKLSRLTLSATAQDGLRLTLDGKGLATASLGTPIALDPGTHQISATQPNRKPWAVSIEVPSGPTNVVVVIPALEAEAKSAALARAKRAEKPVRREIRREGPNDAPVASQQRTVALVLGGVGIVGLAGGGFMGIRYLQHQEDAKATCPSSKSCTVTEIDAHESAVEEAKTARLWSFIGAGAGGAALIGAAYLYFTHDSDEKDANITATPVVGRDHAGASVSMRF